MHDFTRLRVWQRAQKLTLEIYRDTGRFDDFMNPGLGARMRRAAGSISGCIAEGSGQPTPLLLAQSLLQAIAFCTELLSHLDIAHEVGLIDTPRHIMLGLEIQEVRRMLYALRARVEARTPAQTTAVASGGRKRD